MALEKIATVSEYVMDYCSLFRSFFLSLSLFSHSERAMSINWRKTWNMLCLLKTVHQLLATFCMLRVNSVSFSSHFLAVVVIRYVMLWVFFTFLKMRFSILFYGKMFRSSFLPSCFVSFLISSFFLIEKTLFCFSFHFVLRTFCVRSISSLLELVAN